MTYKGRTICKHKRGNWYARIRHDGKRTTLYGRTQLEAYEKLKVFVDLLDNKQKLDPSVFDKYLGQKEVVVIENSTATIPTEKPTVKSYTFAAWYSEWLASYKIGNVRGTTIDGFNKCFRKLKSLHDLQLSDITNLMLSKAINEVESSRTKDAVHNMIKQMFAVAFNNRLIDCNPAITLPRPKQFTKNQKNVLTEVQEKIFIAACLSDLEQYEPLLICVLQGIRKGEMLALRPNDFDFNKGTLRIDESFDQNHPDDLQTKNQDSNRIMPMFELTRQVLLKYRNCKPDERIYDFTTAALLHRLERLLKTNGLPRLTVHELRHTFISRCHEKGIDELIVQKWVGHAKGSRMTKAVYTHVADEVERKYIELLNQNAS